MRKIICLSTDKAAYPVNAMGTSKAMMEGNASSTKRIFRIVILIGFVTSLTIESLQLILKRGLFEFDDIFHNTLGVVIGYWFYRKMRKHSIAYGK